MAFRTTRYDPVGNTELKYNDPSINFNQMEQSLAQEMANLKMEEARRRIALEKVALESPEIKELKAKIQAANLNKARIAQIQDSQLRR